MAPLASYDSLVKRFGSVVAVDGLSFEVPDGSVFGMLGPNGAGKTTAIRVLLGLMAPSEGSTALFGARAGTPGFRAAVRETGTLVEGPALYERASARQNMEIEAAALALPGARAEIDELLAIVDLAGRAEDAAGKFSLGMKQRLGLAIALLGRPRLVVLDEPTNGLDPGGIVEIRELIRRLPERGTTVLVSSHLLSEVQLMCDSAAIMHRGRLVASGSIGELVASGGGRFVVRVAPGLAERAAERLRRAGHAVEARDGLVTVTGEVADGAELSRPLAEDGIYVSELRRQDATLEDVFLALTEGGGGEG